MKESLCKITVNSEPPKPTTFEDLGYVQVVRCKDCKHYYKGHCQCENTIYWNRDPEWFCADGERD